MKKIIVVCILFIMISIQLNFISFAEASTDVIGVRSDELNDFKKIQEQFTKVLSDDESNIFQNIDVGGFIKSLLLGKIDLDFKKIVSGILNFFSHEVSKNFGVILKIITLLILTALFKNLENSFEGSNISKIARYFTFGILAIILFTGMKEVIDIINTAITRLHMFMTISIPILVAFMVISGNFISGGIMQTVLMTIIQLSVTLIKYIVLPLITIVSVISFVNNLTENSSLSKMADFLKQSGIYIFGAIMTVFVGILGLQGFVSGTYDGIAGKSAKFAASTFVPVIGKYIADAYDTVACSMLVIKNATGVMVVIGILTICLAPIIKLLSIILMYKVGCIIIEPIADKAYVNAISDITKTMTFGLAALIAITIMFVFFIAIAIFTTSQAAYIR